MKRLLYVLYLGLFIAALLLTFCAQYDLLHVHVDDDHITTRLGGYAFGPVDENWGGFEDRPNGGFYLCPVHLMDDGSRWYNPLVPFFPSLVVDC